MSCERYRDALKELAAGGTASAGLEAHLASCERCRDELAALRQALATAEAEVARVVGAEPSPALAARIRQSVAGSESAARRVAWLWPAVAAAATLVLAVAAWVVRAPSPARLVESRPAVAPRESRPAEEESRASEAPERTASSPRARALVPARGGSAEAMVRDRRRPPSVAPAAPEVLVPSGEAEALARFAAIVHRGGHTPGAFATVDRPTPALAEPVELAITPLEIVPLDAAETPGT